MRVAITWSALAAATVIAVGGCNSQKEHVFTLSEATTIAAVRPAAAGWIWPHAPDRHAVPSSGATESGPTDPLWAEFKRQTSDLEDIGEKANTWQDDDKLGNLAVGVYAIASDAHQAFTPFNALSLGWAQETGTVTKAEEIDGLGDEA